MPFVLVPDADVSQTSHVDDVHVSDVREDDEILRQLQNTQARISIWSLLASSNMHRNTLTRALTGVIPFLLHQKVKFIHKGQVVTVQFAGDIHDDDDLLLTRFTFDEVQTLEMEDFCRDFVAMSFDQHGSTVVLDMMRSMSYLLGMGLGRRQHGPNEFMTMPDHDILFGLGFIPTEADYRYMAHLRKKWSDKIIGGLSTTQEAELQRLIHQLHLSDRAPDTSSSTLTTPSSPDRMSLMTLYFTDEVDENGTFAEVGDIVDGATSHDEYVDEMLVLSLSQTEDIVQPGLASPFDLFRVFVIEIVKETLTTPTPESTEDAIVVDDLFDGHVGFIEGASDFVDPHISFDALSGFVSRSDDFHDSSSMDLSTFEYLPICRDITLSAPSSPTSQIFDIDDEIV
ncbi:hypothetical protein AAG906_029062 [Vitis piasezkii]